MPDKGADTGNPGVPVSALSPEKKPEPPAAKPAAKKTKKYEMELDSTGRRVKKRTAPCPECGTEFIPTNINQTRCRECILEANSRARSEFIEKARQLALIPKGGNQREGKRVLDSQKIVKVRCRLDKDFPGECPNDGLFKCTMEKYLKGLSFCDYECRKRHVKLKSKGYREEVEKKRTEGRPTEEVRLDYLPHDGQKLIHASRARFKVAICGARWGKDRCSIAEYIFRFAEMLSENRPSTLVPRVHGFIVAPTYALANQIWREMKHFFPPQWIIGKPNEAEKRIETIGNGLIEVKSADNPDSLVSVGLDIVLLTEAARVKDLEYTWGYLRGRLASPDRGPGGKGGVALINSTPKGRTFLYQMYMWGQDKNYPDWESWQFPTASNPYIDPKEVESAEKTLPRNMFRQEFLGEFIEDSGEVFANVEEISKGIPQEPEIGRIYKAAWDPAQRLDYSGFGIRDDRGAQVVKERWTGLPWTAQLDRVEYYCKKYRAHLDMDSTGMGETLPEAVSQRGVSVTGHFFTNALKERLVSHLALLCEGKDIILINDRDQKEELKAYTYTFTKTGKVSYHHPQGGHDDLVTMLMLLYMDFHVKSQNTPFVGLLLGGGIGIPDRRSVGLVGLSAAGGRWR